MHVESKKILKIAFLNIGIAITNILLFSEGFLGVRIFGFSAFQTAFGITAIMVSIMAFLVGNYYILTTRDVQKYSNKEVMTHEECLRAIKRQNLKRTFAKDIVMIEEQADRFAIKQRTINEILLQKFNSEGMSYAKFNRAILDLENLFYVNLRSILNKLEVFDEADYNTTKRGYSRFNSLKGVNVVGDKRKFSKEFMDSKMKLYNEYIRFVSEAVEDNEEMLLKLDRLLLEISKFTSIEEGQLENMSEMKEIDDLITKTKLYK